MAPPLLPIVLLAAVGQPAHALPPVPGTYRGTTDQGGRISIRVGEGGRSGGWRIRYEGRCDDGYAIRGGFRSGGGTPRIRFGRGGSLRVAAEEPAPFRRGGTGTARYELAGTLGPDGGSGTWRIEVTPPRAGVSCTSGIVRWGVARGDSVAGPAE
jgi:hypothetical protein